jgi:hypothetical protein
MTVKMHVFDGSYKFMYLMGHINSDSCNIALAILLQYYHVMCIIKLSSWHIMQKEILIEWVIFCLHVMYIFVRQLFLVVLRRV